MVRVGAPHGALSIHPSTRLTSILFSTLLITSVTHAANEPQPLIQAFLGGLSLDDQQAEWDEVSDDELDVEFPSSLPGGGIEAEYAYGGEALQWGINSGGSIAWKNDDTRFSGGFSGDTGGVIRVEIDNSLFIGELHLGGFLRASLGQAVSVYAAAGPMIMYGKHEVEDDEVVAPTDDGTVVITNSDDSDFAVGLYGRAGIDFRIGKDQFLGLGVRYMAAELDIEDTVGKVDAEGPQFVNTYSAQL
mgnify:CR=1 FL=1